MNKTNKTETMESKNKKKRVKKKITCPIASVAKNG